LHELEEPLQLIPNEIRGVYSNKYFISDMTCIQLESRETKFWRHQKDNPATYLSTIEAVYYLVRDYHDLFVDSSYDGEYDNLLFFFTFMYQKIRNMYDGGKELKAYKQRMKNSSGSETVK
jgi:hypothetical protein